jgi:hypothetical protein
MLSINSHNRFTINKLRMIGFFVLVGLASATHGAFVSVDVHTAVLVDNTTGSRLLSDEVLADEMRTEADLRLSDSSSLGSATAWAGGMASGTLRSLTSATQTPPGSFNSNVGQAVAALSDTLTFTIPAGTYDTALEATLTGNIAGTLSAVGDTIFTLSKVDFTASLSALENVAFNWRDTDGTSFDQDFQITTTLVSAGTTFFSTVQVPVGLGAQLRTESRAVVNLVAASASADFYNTSAVRFLSLDVPEGVTWTSESGQFLVPLPPALWLFGSGLLGLIGMARRKKAA